MTQYGGPVVQGAAGVMIGAPTGVACSVCPGGMTSGNPVNPLLGAKVLPGETDIALPGPLPFMLTRTYSSYRTKTPAPSGIFGPGWKAPFDIRLQLRDDELIINDDGGRSIHFEPLLPGETAFSRSESLWLARGGVAKLHESNVLHVLWQALPEDLRLSPHLYLATSSAQGPWWILGWSARVPGENEALPAPLPPYRVLTGLADRFGRTQIFHREADGESAGNITAVTDGAGRRFRLVLTTQAQRAEAARKQATVSGISAPEYPQTMPVSGYGADSGLRLAEVWLTHDPEYPDNLPALPLARYTYTPRGELSVVYDRSGTPVRSFTYDDKHPGRMTAHQYAGRPQTTYRYDASGRVTEQHNPAGVSYRYEYEKNVITVTDSLNRREVLHTEGEGGLKRVIKEEKADGSTITREFDNAGRMVAMTDAAGRKTEFRLNIGSGNVTEIVTPDGRSVRFSYNDQRQLISTTGTDGLRSQQAFDDRGRLTQEKSRHGDITRYFYDDPHSELPSAIEDTTGSRKQMTWSRYGQLLTLTDCSGYQTRYEYNRFGQVTAIHQEEGLSQYRAYDERGRLVSQKDAAGHKTRYEYNMAGDLTTVTHPDGSRQTTKYDSTGHPVSTTGGGLTRQMEYDAAGRVTRLVNENGADTTFTYDLPDRLAQETGFDGRTQRYQYSITGQLVRSEDENLITLWHYDASGHLTHRTVNDEPAEQWQYNERGWLTETSHLSDGHRVAVQYEYDKQGRMNLERQTVQHPETGELLWQHVTRHDYPQGLATRTTPDNLPTVEWLTYGSGYLAGMKLGVLSDANRAWLAQCGLTPEQIQNQMEPEYTPQRKIHLYHCDHRGLPLALVNSEGKADWSAEYDAWGNVLSENNPHNLKQLIRLPGQQYDEETGLYYNRHRYYDPLQGRYITQDPIGLKGGWNPYQYPLNPVTDTDPLGLAETSESYVVSRDLAALGDEARSRWNPLTHTFTVTTDGQGNILHTYSWGNDANLKGWNLDQSIDLKTAREALDNGLAQPTLAPSHCVEQAYTELNKKENEHINLFITRNCKQETNKLLFKAMAICTNNKWGTSPFPPKPGMYGYSY